MMYFHTSLPVGASTTGFSESAGTDPFLVEFRKQLTAYTKNYLEEYTNATERLGDLLKENPNLEPHWRTAGSRWRRQLVSPGVASLQSRYSDFFAAGRRRNTKRKRKKPQEEEELPIVLVPEEDPTECVTNTQLSSFGFLGFVLNVVNAVINVANNLNNNDNSNNDNDNNNNNNDLNNNQAEITETVSNTNTAAAAGRRIHRLKMMRDAVDANLRRIQTYKTRRRRSPSSCGGEIDVVDEALLAAVALLDMWKELLFEEDPFCMALEVCQTAGKMTQASRLAGMIGQVGAVAAANMLLNFQGVNPEFLVAAAERGAAGDDCTSEYPSCGEAFHRQ